MSTPAAAAAYWTLDEAKRLPLTPADDVLQWGRTVVVTPHPDDESLGCGGVIAELSRAGVPVEIVELTDGRGSHPNSRAYPAERLIALRQAELRQAASELGVAPERVHFCGLEDAAMPALGTPAAERVVARLRARMMDADTVLVTWRRDPHCDHQAAYAYAAAAARGLPVRVLEYPVWVWQSGAPSDAPARDAFRLVRVDIARTLRPKLAAVQAHRSQVTSLITDDPRGFTVPPALLAHFAEPWEIFIEPLC